MSTAVLTRAAVALSLVLAAALTVLSVATMPDFSGESGERLESIAAAPGVAAFSAVTWTWSQLFVAVGALGLAFLIRSRVPVLASVAGALVLLGAFGHAVHSGTQLAMVAMAGDLAGTETHVGVLERLEGGLALPLMAVGLLGTVLGYLTLGAAVWRAGLGPRWVGPALILFVVVEFVGSGFSQWAGYASGALYTVAFLTLAFVVQRSSLAHWQSAAEAAEITEVEVAEISGR